MNRSESKFNNAAKKMQGALVTLLENNEFADISIMDICNQAGVNRSTFYAHYDNTYDLLRETHEAMIGDFLSECTFDNPVDLNDMRNLSKDDLNFATPKYLLPYLKYIQSHKRLYRIYAENAHTFETNNMDDYMIDNLFVPIYAKHGVTDKKLIYYMQKYFLKGLDAIINEWVRHDCEDDILFICEIITFCVRPLSYKE
ncbi:MAG: TetR/AcrR family transcriptional regulator [Clostridia bacterium]|nr:TetR/AcrR family transcriptional regulator [Clostridia bacterium]